MKISIKISLDIDLYWDINIFHDKWLHKFHDDLSLVTNESMNLLLFPVFIHMLTDALQGQNSLFPQNE